MVFWVAAHWSKVLQHVLERQHALEMQLGNRDGDEGEGEQETAEGEEEEAEQEADKGEEE